MTYNILADKYSGLFSEHPDALPEERAAVHWSSRMPLILAEILSYLPAHVLCLQEVEEPFFYRELGGLLAPHGFRGQFLPREDVRGRHGEVHDGIALFWHEPTLELLGHRSLIYREAALPGPLASAASDPASTRLAESYRQRGEGALLAHLRHRASGRRLVVANTHLFWNPVHPDIKALQAAALTVSCATGRPGAGVCALWLGVHLDGRCRGQPRKRCASWPAGGDPGLPEVRWAGHTSGPLWGLQLPARQVRIGQVRPGGRPCSLRVRIGRCTTRESTARGSF